ncbi:uncharacterized protein LOC100899344 [Galendromus occidentalis]|uniref:Uncharacterized protein LOC100899344 n=1 Tax=Galendromus occidentalis TaxID=34638 RepID=A0AAJ6VZV5_9ACAR|nr:uncharacterized protein LOC100899344 [Galendromus occidentalis]
MKVFVIFCLLVPMSLAATRTRRAAYDFADGVDEVVGQVRTTFQCPQRYGYFADVDNDCKVYHVCNPIRDSQDNIQEVQHFSFFCGNQTVFDQLTLTCSHPEEAVPCPNAPDFFYVNDKFGVEEAPFLMDTDVERAAPLKPGYKGTGSPAYAASSRQDAYVSTPGAFHQEQNEPQDDHVPSNTLHFGQRTQRSTDYY